MASSSPKEERGNTLALRGKITITITESTLVPAFWFLIQWQCTWPSEGVKKFDFRREWASSLRPSPPEEEREKHRPSIFSQLLSLRRGRSILTGLAAVED